MSNYGLLPSQKVKIFNLIRNYDFNPKDFNWTTITRQLFQSIYYVEKISYKDGESFFVFDSNLNKRYAHYSPGNESISSTEDVKDWDDFFIEFDNWLQNVIREEGAPNVWKALSEEAPFLGNDISTSDNSLFTKEEIKIIEIKLAEIHTELISLHKFRENDKQDITKQFAHIRESSEKMGRKDWTFFLLGNLVQIGIQYLTPENLKTLMQIAQGLFNFLSNSFKALASGWISIEENHTISWDKSMGTGNAYIDNQHKDLIEKFNEVSHIFEGNSIGKMVKAAGSLLDFLQFYAAWHFKQEEALMDRFHSPVAEANKIAHAEFLSNFGKFYTQWQHATMDVDLARETYNSLGLWIKNHIMTIDSQLCVNIDPCL